MRVNGIHMSHVVTQASPTCWVQSSHWFISKLYNGIVSDHAKHIYKMFQAKLRTRNKFARRANLAQLWRHGTGSLRCRRWETPGRWCPYSSFPCSRWIRFYSTTCQLVKRPDHHPRRPFICSASRCSCGVIRSGPYSAGGGYLWLLLDVTGRRRRLNETSGQPLDRKPRLCYFPFRTTDVCHRGFGDEYRNCLLRL